MSPIVRATGQDAWPRAKAPRRPRDSFGTRRQFELDGERFDFHSLAALGQAGPGRIDLLPYSLRILLENLLRHEDGEVVTKDSIEALARWEPGAAKGECAFHPARVLMPDSSGAPLLVDLAAMRDELAAQGLDPELVSPTIPVDLVVDHSAVTEFAGSPDAFGRNQEVEFRLNAERYALIRWAQRAFTGIRVVPPGNGILHQINLERLAEVVRVVRDEEGLHAFPDSLVGMDSHTPMVNALSVFGWGVGGIEAASAMLGEAISMLVPEVVGCRLTGQLPPGVTATDLVLTLTALLREADVVGRFVEFCGPGLDALTVPDRATIANMAPEYGATMGFFPVDGQTLSYLRSTGRTRRHVRLVERYAREQLLWRDAEPRYSAMVELDLGTVRTTLAGPRRPQDRVSLAGVHDSFVRAHPQRIARGAGLTRVAESPGEAGATVGEPGEPGRPGSRRDPDAADGRALGDGDVVIAAITSCTNTSNPTVMIGAGLLARNALARGLRAKPWVKTSLAPGSRRVGEYLARAGLDAPLADLGFHVVGYGCMTCMGSSGSFTPAIEAAIRERRLDVVSVLSGNRNFEARVHPLVRANYLASPPMVVAYSIAGTVRVDLERDPLGFDAAGAPVMLRDVWPRDDEIAEIAARVIDPDLFVSGYSDLEEGSEKWNSVPHPAGSTFEWDPASTYIRRPPYVTMASRVAAGDIALARAIVILGDGVTTDHITPVGSTGPESEVGRYLGRHGVVPGDFNSLSSRRTNPEVVVRCTFANVLLRNEIVPGREGDVTRHFPGGEAVSVFEAAVRYRREGVPLVVIAGRNYGAGSSRDTAAKGVRLLGVRAIVAESFERIHRSNLVGMGVLPLEFLAGTNRRTLALTGEEQFDLVGTGGTLFPGSEVRLRVRYPDGTVRETALRLRVDTTREAAWCAAGGIMPYVLAKLAGSTVASR